MRNITRIIKRATRFAAILAAVLVGTAYFSVNSAIAGDDKKVEAVKAEVVHAIINPIVKDVKVDAVVNEVKATSDVTNVRNPFFFRNVNNPFFFRRVNPFFFDEENFFFAD
jgi:hypothetical protein